MSETVYRGATSGYTSQFARISILVVTWVMVFTWPGALVSAQSVSFTHRGDLLNPVSGFTVYADCAVDMNGDYLDDVVRVGAKGIYIDFQQPDGSFVQRFHPLAVLSPPSWSVCAGDLDNNGFNDLLFADTESVAFIKADRSGHTYGQEIFTPAMISQRATLADINNDGWLDAFVCNDIGRSIPFRNDGNGQMTFDSMLILTSDLPGSYSAIWTDYDLDGDSDLYVSKCLSGAPPGDPVRTNLLYRNNGDGSYSEVANAAGVDDNGQSWATAFEDFDNDGDLDAFVVNHDMQNRLYRNNGDGTFTDVIATSGIDAGDLGAFENVAGDFNNDGYLDIFSDLFNSMYYGQGDLTFVSDQPGVTPGAIADLNNDGFLDVTSQGQVWLNEGNENHWLKVDLFGLQSNRNGIGARVVLFGGGVQQVREMRSGQSYSPMQTLTVHFGTGLQTSVDSLKVIWPSGLVTVLEDLTTDTTYLVPEVECVLILQPSSVQLSLCPGDTVHVSAPEGYFDYAWSQGDSTRSVSLTEPGSYHVMLTNDLGCRGIMRYSVLPRDDTIPSISVQPSNRSCASQTVILRAVGGDDYVWSNGQVGDTLLVNTPGAYTVATDARCSAEQLVSPPMEVTFLSPSLPGTFEVISLPGDSVQISVEGDDCHWFDSEQGGTLLHVGCVITVDEAIDDTLYVASQTEFAGEMINGGKADTALGAGVSLQTGFMHFEAWQPFVLRSVKVFLPEYLPAGNRFVQLFSRDTLLAFKQFNVSHGWNELELDFTVPVGEMSLHCPQGNLFRDAGEQDYPYALGSAGQITRSSFGKEYYYYFYDWKIETQAVTCMSPRIAVAPVASATLNRGEEAAIEVYPVPAHESISVKWNMNGRQPAVLRLTDLAGRVISEWHAITGNDQRLALDGAEPGMYWLSIKVGNKIDMKKIVIL